MINLIGNKKMNDKAKGDKNLAKILALRENLRKRKTQQKQRKDVDKLNNSDNKISKSIKD